MILYHHLTRCRFLYRVNRFIARCDLDGQEITVHVKNTGRLGELLVPGAVCWLEAGSNPARKTAWDLVAVEKCGYVVNIDSQAPNKIVREWLLGGGLGKLQQLQSEVTHGDSRFDFAFVKDGHGGLIEVKGVTLFDDEGTAFFPDAPTQRGTKHLLGLAAAARNGMECHVCFVLQRDDVHALRPHDTKDPAFGEALRQAKDAGVHITAAVCRVTPDSAAIIRTVPVILK